MSEQEDSKHALLVCSVGGSPEPVVAALKRWRPHRVRFVPSRATKSEVSDRIVPLAEAEGCAPDPGRWDILELPSGQNFTACIDTLRELTPVVEEWLGRGQQYQVVVDFTGGTKCMSAALVLQAHRWRCVFSYVGGTERTKEGVGVVISGQEQVLHDENPWDTLGFQAVEEFSSLFDVHAFSAAAALADRAMRNTGGPTRKREMVALKTLAEAYDAWDRFDHGAALNKLEELSKFDNDLRAVLGQTRADPVRSTVGRHREYLQKLTREPRPSILHVSDLLTNARRRRDQGQIDDAVARLYRAIEAIAQIKLAEDHYIDDTGRVPIERVPEQLRGRLSRSGERTVSVGLQEAYALLLALGDDAGAKFRELRLDDPRTSPLSARNRSILAHGFERAGDKVFDQLWRATVQLAFAEEASLPAFPRIGG